MPYDIIVKKPNRDLHHAGKRAKSLKNIDHGSNSQLEKVISEKAVREGYHLIDKTRFIREALESISEVSLITRPRRFGKTMTLSMMYHFLEMGILEKDTQGLFEHFEISQDRDFCEAYQNKISRYFYHIESGSIPHF